MIHKNCFIVIEIYGRLCRRDYCGEFAESIPRSTGVQKVTRQWIRSGQDSMKYSRFGKKIDDLNNITSNSER